MARWYSDLEEKYSQG
jgi:hypothetical protein